jgi:uncharacterized protein (UPF0333 family)
MNTKQSQIALAVIVVLVLIVVGVYYFYPMSGGTTSTTATSTAATSTSATGATTKTSTAGGSTSKTSTVSDAPSTEGVSLSASPSSGTSPFTTKFLGAFPISLNSSYTFGLVYGDGISESAVSSCIGSVCTVGASHTYKISGSFTPELTATPKCATTIPVAAACPHDTFTIGKSSVVVTGGNSTATLEITNTSVKVGEPIDVMVTGSGSTLKVDFGDGTTDSLAPMTAQTIALTHAYSTPGNYAIKVTSGTQTFVTQDVIIQS